MKKIIVLLVCIVFITEVKAQVNIDSLLGVWNNLSENDDARLAAIHKVAYSGYVYSKPDSAFHYASFEYDFAKSVGSKIYMGVAANTQGASHYIRGNYDEAMIYYLRSMKISKELDDTVRYAATLNNIGNIHVLLGERDKAYEAFNEVLKTFEELGNQKNIAASLSNISRIYHSDGNYQKAMEYTMKALGLRETLKDKRELAGSYVNAGTLYQTMKDFDKALEFYNKSLEASEVIGDQQGVAVAYLNIGAVHFILTNFDQAIQYLNVSKEYCEELGFKEVLAQSLNILAQSYIGKNDFEKALKLNQQSLTLRKEIGDKDGISESLSTQGSIYYKKSAFEQTISFSSQALQLGDEIGAIERSKDASFHLYQAYKAIGQSNKALSNYEQYITLRDSIVNEENQRSVLRQEYQYSYDKQVLTDSLNFAKKEEITNLQLQKNEATLAQQRLGLIATILGLLLLGFLAYFFYQSKKRQEIEAERIKELDAFKSTFYTNITHEFRTPLTVILGMTEQIEEAPEKHLEEGIALIKRNGKNLLGQINQILDLSKLETNSLQMNMIQSNIIEFLRYSTEAFQSFANGQNLSLRFFSSTEELLMDYDPDSIQNIMSNLISNAIKFTSDGGDVKIVLDNRDKQLTIKVQDTGAGIAEKDLPLVFDRFYQVENSNDSNGFGTGVGLAYVKALVDMHGGQITVESEIGKGSTFLIQLPITNNEALVTDKVDKQEVMNWKPIQHSVNKVGSSMTIVADKASTVKSEHLPQLLLIEDNADVVIYLKSCLEDQYQIEVAYNGRIGIEKAIENIPDLIISDVMMPEKDGFEVCNTLKNDERTSHIPIILLTAKADVASKIDGLRRGADAYLSKPFDKEELLVRLQMLVKRQKDMVTYFSQSNGTSVIDSLTIEEAEEVVQVEHVFIQKVNAILEEHFGNEDFGLPQLCQKVGMSRSQLFRKMKALTDTAPSAFIKNYRLRKAKYLLENTEMNVAEVTYEVGFKDPSYFSKIFMETYGVLPSATSK